MRHANFEKLGLVLIATLVVGACSPLAPSVSKLSNAGAHPTDGSLQSSGNLVVPGSIVSRSANKALPADPSSLGTETTEVLPLMAATSDDLRALSLDSAQTSFQLKREALGDLISKGVVSFQSPSDDIKGQENSLTKDDIRLELVVDDDAATIKKMHLNDINASLTWHAATSAKDEAHWELRLDKPSDRSGDPVTDIEAQEIRDNLADHLVKVIVLFQI